MSPVGSPSAPGEAGDSAGESAAWHPAHEWLEEDDEQDMDYHPAMEMDESDEVDAWEESSVEDNLDVMVTDGELTAGHIGNADLTNDFFVQRTHISTSAIFNSSSRWRKPPGRDRN